MDSCNKHTSDSGPFEARIGMVNTTAVCCYLHFPKKPNVKLRPPAGVARGYVFFAARSASRHRSELPLADSSGVRLYIDPRVMAGVPAGPTDWRCDRSERRGLGARPTTPPACAATALVFRPRGSPSYCVFAYAPRCGLA